jgi:hypothetical protein
MKNINEKFAKNLSKFKSIEKKTITEKLFSGEEIIIPDNKFSPYDLVFPKGKSIIEIKNRRFSSETFDNKYNGEMMIETQKVEKLLNITGRGGKYEGYLACILFYFDDDVFQYIILNRIDFKQLEREQRNTPTNSCDVWANRQDEYVYIIPKEILNKNNFVRRKITL